jgi:serine/threonine protein kinase
MGAGAKLGRYELLARIATGGMGEIFLARLEGAAGFEKLCVIKRILPHLADDTRFRSMLIAEARIASNMSHANICHVYELDEIDNQLYLVMEYLEGVTLLQLLRAMSQRRQQLDLGFIAGVVLQTCEGLHYAHELRDRAGVSLGVVHRDVTPSNLFLTQSGVVKLVDFGIAKAKDSVETSSGAVKGKVAYMAPEQVRGQPIDRRVDVFSLGVVVFEMLTCRRLYQRKTDYLTFRALMEDPQIDLATHRPDAPEAITAVLVRALSRDPETRYATVRELADDLIEAFGAIRPWGQGDVSEFVRSSFAAEINLENAEISRIVRRSSVVVGQSIPVIARRTSDSEGADDLPIEPDVGDLPPAGSGVAFGHSSDVRSAAFGEAMRVPRRSPLATLPPDLPAPVRRHIPPAVGVAGVAGGSAILLVIGLALIGGRAPRRATLRKPRVAVTAPAGGVEQASDRRRPIGPYGAALRGCERELDQCAREHPDALPIDAKATLVLGADGLARHVTLRPLSADQSGLGGCIRRVLQTVVFPAAPSEKELALGLALHR